MKNINKNCKLDTMEDGKQTQKVALYILVHEQIRDEILQAQIQGLYNYCSKHDYKIVNEAIDYDYDNAYRFDGLINLKENNEITKLIILDSHIAKGSMNENSLRVLIITIKDGFMVKMTPRSVRYR